MFFRPWKLFYGKISSGKMGSVPRSFSGKKKGACMHQHEIENVKIDFQYWNLTRKIFTFHQGYWYYWNLPGKLLPFTKDIDISETYQENLYLSPRILILLKLTRKIFTFHQGYWFYWHLTQKTFPFHQGYWYYWNLTRKTKDIDITET